MARARAKPMAMTSPRGDAITVSIGPSGQTTIRSADAKKAELGSITVRGLTPAEATSKKKGFWGRLWDGIKAAVSRVVDAITFGVGGATCRPSVSVGTSKGRITKVLVGVSCTN
jgi:hypothetical protein